ncbi:Na+/H+ antiporter NhaC family protein [Pullulanibacillus sp. KACC 23026]|uniref:Na+/H+ antiporter NhaC family protein n=1 Tax=Pullulanibacillus sp. KACC 23026 TaxID=3028315 RepID=UPI0023AF6E83|nr:Na+/H+ antiporter NhaC family protein [Pullulanibacillus sp. KACC 23026]WEG11966.1 Na+/H+ antiporter NhaC family protein [Pullulanibacillus sp. KACC 23026]
MHAYWLSIVPFIVVIPIAIITKQVLPALALGLVVGSYLYSPHWIGGIQAAVNFVITALVEKSNIEIILFLYIFTGLVGMMKQTGGIKGFVKWSAEHVKTKKQALFLIWISILGTFSSPSFRMVTIGPIMRALIDKVNISAKELGYVIETTGTPIIALIPVATAFVGYMTSIINVSLKNNHITGDPYLLFIHSIPYNFFSFSIILLGIYFGFFHHDRKKVKHTAIPENEVQAKAKGWEDCHPVVAKELPAKSINLLVPLILVIVLTLLLTYISGVKHGGSGFQTFIKADVLNAMLVALIISTFLAFFFYLIQRFRLTDLMNAFFEGANNLMTVVALLSIVWGLSLVTNKLGFATFVTRHVSWIPPAFTPPVLFILGAMISYFIGSSWGTWGILMPLGVAMAHTSGASLPVIVGAVFASGAFGTFSSPLSDDTNTMAGVLDLEAVSYAHYKLKSGLIAAGVSAIGYLLVSFIH